MQPTYNPNKRKRLTTHGFRERMKQSINVLKARRLKGRWKLTVSDDKRKYGPSQRKG